eukprot:g45188.t1
MTSPTPLKINMDTRGQKEYRDPRVAAVEYTTTEFISKCMEVCLPKKSILVFPNQKTWMNWEIHCLLKTRPEVPICFKKTTIMPVTKNTHATCLNDYRPVTLMSIIMKCFKRLVTAHSNSSLPACLDPLQFAYRHTRSTADAIFQALHVSLEHLDDKDTYIRLLFIDYRGGRAPIYINRAEVTKVKNIKILGTTMTDNLSGTSQADATVKKTQQYLFFLRWLRKFGMSIRTLTNSYRCTIESILSGCVKAWYSKCSALDWKKLQKVVCTAQTSTEANIPSMDSIYTSRCHRKVANIIKDPSDSGTSLVLGSGTGAQMAAVLSEMGRTVTKILVHIGTNNTVEDTSNIPQLQGESGAEVNVGAITKQRVQGKLKDDIKNEGTGYAGVGRLQKDLDRLGDWAKWQTEYNLGKVRGKDVLELVGIQRRFTRMIPGMQGLSYEERLKTLGLYLMEFRKMRGDLFETYRILGGPHR